MTAIRVVDDHVELTNVGQTTHVQLDTHVSSSQFLVLSSSANVPPEARLLSASAGVSLTDAGAGNTLTIGLNVEAGTGVSLTTGSTGKVTISATGGGPVTGTLPTPTTLGQILFATTTGSFVAALPITTLNSGWLVNDQGYLLVSS